MTQTRIDYAPITGIAEKLENGFFRCVGNLSRIGIYSYLDSEGNIKKELRHPEDVFAPESLRSFEQLPLTLEHPAELLTAENAAKYTVGNVAHVKSDADKVFGSFLITEKKALDAITAGKKEISPGYTVDLDETPGITDGIPGIPDGLAYDARQKNIRGNHVAIVSSARGGEEIALRLDSAKICVKPGEPVLMKGDRMKKRIDEEAGQSAPKDKTKSDPSGGEKNSQPDLAELLIGMSEKIDALMSHLMKTDEKPAGESDDKEAKEAADEKAEKMDSKKVAELVRARVDLELSAKKVLGEGARLDSLSALDVKKEVIKKVFPDLDMRSKSAGYLDARFDLALEKWEEVQVQNYYKADAVDLISKRAAFETASANLWKGI